MRELHFIVKQPPEVPGFNDEFMLLADSGTTCSNFSNWLKREDTPIASGACRCSPETTG